LSSVARGPVHFCPLPRLSSWPHVCGMRERLTRVSFSNVLGDVGGEEKLMSAADSRHVVAWGLPLAAVALLAAGCSKSSPSGPSSSTVPTLTINAAGVSPTAVRVEVGQQVRVVNNDTQNHQIASNPHPAHTDCPPLNELLTLTPGASGMTGALTRTGTCGFHDHLHPRDTTFQGQILVGVSQPGPGPTY
jgi:plastocyanin